MFAAKNKVEYKEEMVDPSGTVNTAKLTDEIQDVSPSDSLESSGEDFAASARTHIRVLPLRHSPTETKSVETRHTRGTHRRSSLHRHRPDSPPQTVLSYRTTNSTVLFRTKRLSRWKEATKGVPEDNERRSHTGSSGQPGCSASPRTHD